MIPLLYTTHNRLEFTKQTLPMLFNNTLGDVLFVILDTGSTDGTAEYLQKNLKTIAGNKNYVLFLERDMRVSEAMDFFFGYIKQYLFEYAAKVDNDTVVPLDWLTALLDSAKKNNIDILQARHHIMNNNVKNWEEWMSTLQVVHYGKYKLYLNNFVGGSGIVLHNKTTIPFSMNSNSQRPLHGWTELQAEHTEWVKAFHNDVFITLLDMKADNVLDSTIYPEYYTLTQRKT